jgi:hypothetical protein
MIAATQRIAVLAALMLRPGIWDAQAAAWSRLIPHDWPGDFAEHWAALIREKKAEVCDAVIEGRRVGVVVFSICREYPTPELVILGAFASAGGHDLTAEAFPQIYRLAIERGCRTVRFHTMRAGLIAKAVAAGWTVSEVVVRKDLHG